MTILEDKNKIFKKQKKYGGKKMKKKNILALIFGMVVFLFIGCTTDVDTGGDASPTPSGDDDTINIALITKMVDSPYWQTVKENAEKKAEELGNVVVTHMGPPTESDIDAQVQLVENAINNEYDGIILAAGDKDALVEPVRKAKDAGIPVVMIDSGISEEIYDAFLATDNVEAGREAAKLMSELIGGEGEIAIVNFAAGTQTAVDRETGFVEEIEGNHPNIEIVGIQYSNSDPTVAANQATDFISANPNLKGIWGANDQSAIGVAQAVTEQGKGDDIIVIGFDNSADIIAGLDQGTIDGTAVQMPSLMGSDGVQIILDLIDGKVLDSKDVDTGVTMVNQNNFSDEDIQAILHQ